MLTAMLKRWGFWLVIAAIALAGCQQATPDRRGEHGADSQGHARHHSRVGQRQRQYRAGRESGLEFRRAGHSSRDHRSRRSDR